MENSNEVSKVNSSDLIHSLVINGDLSKMTPEQKVQYYKSFCESLGLNPLTQPFQVIAFQGKQRLYATKDCTEQLRKIHKVSITDISTNIVSDIFIVTAKAKDVTGKLDASTGAINIKGLSGDNLANALMKAETKAKRRVTLSICGLGLLNEAETETMSGAEMAHFDTPAFEDGDFATTTSEDALNEYFSNIPAPEEKQLLRNMVYKSTFNEDERNRALETIENCVSYEKYAKIEARLSEVKKDYNEVANPNSTDAAKMVKKIVGSKPE